jgi:hypothetical protein
VCSLISFGQAAGVEPIHIPGWGNLPGSSYAQVNTTVEEPVDGDGNEFSITVKFNYELLFPQLALPFLSLGVMDFGPMNDNHQLELSKTCSMTRAF